MAIPNSQLVASQQNPTVNRTLYIEPSYLVYVDNVVFPSSGVPGFNITFQVLSQSCFLSANAYGPSNQTLGTTATFSNSSLSYTNMTISVNAAGVTSFTLYTIIDGMTFNFGNYTAFVNFYPTVNTPSAGTTAIYLPSGSQLVSCSDNSLSNSTTGTVLSGSKDLLPTNSSLGSVVYAGNYQLLEVESLGRVMEITSSSILVQDTLTLQNIDNIYGSTKLSAIQFNLPQNASGISVIDSIGYLTSTQANNTISVALRNTLYPASNVAFTLIYSLPASSLISSSNGRTVVSSNVVPEWLNMPVRDASVTLLMPYGSSDPQMTGANFTTYQYHPAAVANYSLLTPFTNQPFTLSYVASPIWPYLGQILIIVVVVAIVALYVLYRIRWAKKASPPAKTVPPTTTAKKPQSK